MVIKILTLMLLCLFLESNRDIAEKKQVVSFIKLKYNITIKSDQIFFITPWDVIKKHYGIDSQKVYDQVFSVEDNSDDKYTLLRKAYMNKQIPTIVDDPNKYDESISKIAGFCSSDSRYGVYCVVKSDDPFYLSHELSHAAQIPEPNFAFIFKNKDISNLSNSEQHDIKYLVGSRELGVRLAQFKRKYYKLTGIIIDSESVADKAVEHLLQNPRKYDTDSLSIEELLPILEKIPDGKFRFIKKICELLPKLVSITQPNNFA